MSKPVVWEMSREQAFEKAKAWMVENYGIAKGMEPEQKDRWCERYGMLIHFLDDMFSEEKSQ